MLVVDVHMYERRSIVKLAMMLESASVTWALCKVPSSYHLQTANPQVI